MKKTFLFTLIFTFLFLNILSSFAEGIDPRAIPIQINENPNTIGLGADIFGRYKSYKDEYKGDYYYSLGTNLYTTNGFLYNGSTYVDPLIKIMYLEGQGPKRKDGKTPWQEDYFRLGAGIRTVFSPYAEGKFTLGVNIGDKEGLVSEGELNFYPKLGPVYTGFHFLANREMKYNTNFVRGRAEADFVKIGKLRFGLGGEAENWDQDKDGKSSSHTRIGPLGHIRYGGETVGADFRVIYQFTDDEGDVVTTSISLDF